MKIALLLAIGLLGLFWQPRPEASYDAPILDMASQKIAYMAKAPASLAPVPGAEESKSEEAEDNTHYSARNYEEEYEMDIQDDNATSVPSISTHKSLIKVIAVIDGDTIDVEVGGKRERLRLIGINTPETVDPRKPVECFGREASAKAKSMLQNALVRLEADSTQGERDKYDRLLRYVFLEDGTNFNLKMIEEGYAYEYTYNMPYEYQREFKDAERQAREAKRGLWGDICSGEKALAESGQEDASCTIKGNINAEGEKIYHTMSCASYAKTVINESAGERWFCAEKDALDAGWRKALNCN